MKMEKYYSSDAAPSPEEKMPKPEQHSHEDMHHHSGKPGLDRKIESFLSNRYALIGIVILIIVINIIMRLGLLQYQGLFEPDGFFYYATILQAIRSHYVVSGHLNLSGFPSHNQIGESPGLIYLALIAYIIVHGITGINALVIMRWLPIAFGVIYAMLAYLLARKLTKSRMVGLLAMFLVSVSSGNIARTAGTIFRGDSFITLPIMVALLFMIMAYEADNRMRKCVYAVLSAVALSCGVIVWNGSPFIIIVYMFGLILAIFYSFVAADKEMLLSSVIISVALLLTNILEQFYVLIKIARPVELTSWSFFVLYVPILVGSIIAYLLVSRKDKITITSTWTKRLVILAVLAILATAALYIGFGSFICGLAQPLSTSTTSSTGAVQTNATKQAISATTQELQAPSAGFLWSSFNMQLYLAPIGVILFLVLAYLAASRNNMLNTETIKLSGIGFIVLLAYFGVTSYLQASAIRFNAIISVPMAIFAAFGLYVLCMLLYNREFRSRTAIGFIGIVLIGATIWIYYNLYSSLRSAYPEIYISIWVIFAMLAAMIIYDVYSLVRGHIKPKYIIILAVLIFLIFNSYNTYYESYSAVQADGINSQFLAAMSWMRNNTPSNSTVLALWPDGSVVEGWGNRTSYMDSVGGENGTRIYPFSIFLFNTTPDTQYLYSIGKPDYLVSRNFWYAELGGIAQEGLVQNATAYGYVILNSLNSSSNSTAQFFSFVDTSYPYYTSELVVSHIQTSANSSTSVYRPYLGIRNSSRLTLMRSVIFLNSSSGSYREFNISANESINYTLMVSYDGQQITGAYVLGPKLTSSNVFKFTFLCNTDQCPYGNQSTVTLTPVFTNGDTKIFKINYNGG